MNLHERLGGRMRLQQHADRPVVTAVDLFFDVGHDRGPRADFRRQCDLERSLLGPRAVEPQVNADVDPLGSLRSEQGDAFNLRLLAPLRDANFGHVGVRHERHLARAAEGPIVVVVVTRRGRCSIVDRPIRDHSHVDLGVGLQQEPLVGDFRSHERHLGKLRRAPQLDRHAPREREILGRRRPISQKQRHVFAAAAIAHEPLDIVLLDRNGIDFQPRIDAEPVDEAGCVLHVDFSDCLPRQSIGGEPRLVTDPHFVRRREGEQLHRQHGQATALENELGLLPPGSVPFLPECGIGRRRVGQVRLRRGDGGADNREQSSPRPGWKPASSRRSPFAPRTAQAE